MKPLLIIVSFLAFFGWCIPVDGETMESKFKGIRVTYETNQETKHVDFYVENLETFYVTYTLQFTRLDNLKADVLLPFHQSISGREKKKAFSLEPMDSSKNYLFTYQYHWTLGNMNSQHDNHYVYALPYAPNKPILILQGYNGSFSHFGESAYAIDFDMTEGTEVLACRGGLVVDVEGSYSERGIEEKYKMLNNYVFIQHDDGTIGKYLHFRHQGIAVQTNQRVEAGDLIGYSGNVGYSTRPHLHFDVFKAIDGNTSETIPVKFMVQGGEAITLQEGNRYFAPSNGTVESVPTGKILHTPVPCKGIKDHEADQPTDHFNPSDTVFVYIPILTRGIYSIQAQLKTMAGKIYPIATIQSEVTWTYCYFYFQAKNLNLENQTTEYTVQILVDDRLEVSVPIFID